MIFIRRLPAFEYIAPKNLGEASSYLARHKDESSLMAGGTDLLLKMKRREVVPKYLVSLKAIPDLAYIKEDEEGLKIGPMCTIHAIETSPLIAQKYPILRETSLVFASAQIRNLATVAGNLCNAAPSADMAPPLLALGATLWLRGPRRGKSLPLERFFTGPFTQCLKPGEVMEEIRIPRPAPRSAGTYIKLTLRNAMDHALVGVAVMLALGRDNTCQDVKIALGACAPTPVRAIQAEEVLKGNSLSPSAIEKAAKAAVAAAQPRSDPDYKRDMVEVLTRRALTQVWQRAQKSQAAS